MVKCKYFAPWQHIVKAQFLIEGARQNVLFVRAELQFPDAKSSSRSVNLILFERGHHTHGVDYLTILSLFWVTKVKLEDVHALVKSTLPSNYMLAITRELDVLNVSEGVSSLKLVNTGPVVALSNVVYSNGLTIVFLRGTH